MQPKLSDNVFLQSLSTRQRTVLLKHHIYSKEDLINFAIKQDLKKLRSNCPNQLSENSLKQLEEFLPKKSLPYILFTLNFLHASKII